jgi:MFS transporter, PPP family, 3-phenylpropionic acid transporter
MRSFVRAEIGFAPRLAALYGAYFIGIGIQMPFFPLWLKAKGLDAELIGVVLAAPLLARLIAIPLVTRQADRREALRGAIMLATGASVLGYGLVGLAEGPAAILAAFALASLAFTPIMPLAETYALKGLSARGRAYGPVRLWGSATFILGSMTAGFVADVIPARDLIWLIAAASLLTALVAFGLAPLEAAPHADAPPTPGRSLLRDPSFIAVLAAASLIQSSHAVFYGFSALQWHADGLDGTAIAGLWALGVVAEIVLFALQGRLPAFLTPAALILVGGLGAILRWSVMALDPPVGLLPFVQLLHALSFGTTHLGALGFVSRHAPPGQGATAQGYLALAIGTTMAAMTGLSGVLYGAYGTRAYAAMALVAVGGSVAGYIAIRRSARPIAAV